MSFTVPSDVVAFIDVAFPRAKEQEAGGLHKGFEVPVGHRSDLAALLELLRYLPRELVRLEPRAFGEYASAVAVIRETLETWRHDSRQGMFYCGSGALNPVTVIRRALSRCPDVAVPEATAGLEFVVDADLRASLRLDLAAAEAALTAAQWKAATVLAGSVIEALLLDSLGRQEQDQLGAAGVAAQERYEWRRSPTPTALGEWNLSQYVGVARQMGLVASDTWTACDLAKDYRNLIHPGAAQRHGIEASRETARIALAAVGLVFRDLERSQSRAGFFS